MDQPAQDSIDWIDWWVIQQVAQVAPPIPVPVPGSPVEIQTYMTLTQPQELNGWKVCQTSGNANDCMINSLLIELSPTFQRLSPEIRDRIARTYRTTVFASILPNEASKSRAKSKAFLEDRDLLAFGNYYNINILTYIPTNSEFQFVSTNKQGQPCIIIHYNGYNHYSAMLSYDNTPFINFDDAERLAAEFTRKPTDLYCEYAVDSLIEYGGQQKKVIERRFPDEATFKGYKFCNALRVVNPDFNVVIGVRGGTEWDYIIGEAAEAAGKEEISEANFLTEAQRKAREQYAARQRAPPPGSARGSSSQPPSFLPSYGEPVRGRAGSFELDEKELVLKTELKSLEQQESEIDAAPEALKSLQSSTLEALEALRRTAEAKLKKLEFVQWFFESGLPLDCENLQKGKLTANINKRLGEFEDLNLLDKLYKGIFPDENSGDASPKTVDVKTKKQALLNYFTSSSSDMPEMCKLAKWDLVLNNVSKFNEVARQPKYDGLFDENKKFIQPPQDAKLWKKLLEELQKRFKFTKANVSTLLPYLEGSNALLAYRRAARFNSSDIQPGPLQPFSNLAPTKWLREVLTAYGLPGFPIQIAIDFEREDISDAFVKDIPEEKAKAALQYDYSFLNGKEFVKNMVTNRSIPSTFKLANEFAGKELTQKLVEPVEPGEGAYFVTQKIPFLEENAPVFISKEITEEVDNFERLDKNQEEFNKMPLSQVSVPIFIIFSCLKRKKLSRTKIWQTLMTKKGKPTQQDQAEIDRFIAALTEKNLLYAKNDEGEYIFEAFHTSIIILCNGKIYTMGYGSDPFYDAEQASAKDGADKIKYLKKMEGIIKNITGLRDVQILGTGFIYSPDSLNIEDEELNYRIVDAGILKKSNIVRLNKILALVKQTRAITMVIGEAKDEDERIVTVEQLSCQTMCIYSRLATRYTQGLPFASQLMNCSSFVELGFPERINCTATLGYSDPNACISKKFGKNVPIKQIFDSYFAPDTTIGRFKNIVGYVSDVPPLVRKFNELLKRVATVSIPRFMHNPKAIASVPPPPPPPPGDSKDSSTKMEEDSKGGALKLKNRKKHKRPKNTTARKSSNK